MSKSNLQINLEYWIARTSLALFSALPLRVAISIGATLGRLFYFVAGGLRRTGLRNLQLAFPAASDRERRTFLKGSFANLGRLLGIFSHFNDESAGSLRGMIRAEGLEHLESARQHQRGVILFTGHVGAWELSSFALSLLGFPLSFLVRRIDNPRIESLIERFRTHAGNRTIDKRSAAREMLKILNGGGTLGILVDLNTLDREAIFVDFFDRQAATTFLVAKLALRTKALVLPVFAPWDRTRKEFLLKIGRPLEFQPTGDEDRDVRSVTQLLTRVVEENIRQYPDQWLWIHRRWKTRPPGEPALYD